MVGQKNDKMYYNGPSIAAFVFLRPAGSAQYSLQQRHYVFTFEQGESRWPSASLARCPCGRVRSCANRDSPARYTDAVAVYQMTVNSLQLSSLPWNVKDQGSANCENVEIIILAVTPLQMVRFTLYLRGW